ncbi:amidohydrolase family protein [Pseudonocardia benzenivorans]
MPGAIAGTDADLVDIGVSDGRIVRVDAGLPPGARELDAGGRLVLPASSTPTCTWTSRGSPTGAPNGRERWPRRSGRRPWPRRRSPRRTSTSAAVRRWRAACCRAPRGCAPTSRWTPPSDCAASTRSPASRPTTPGPSTSSCVFAQEGMTDSDETDRLVVTALERGVPVIGGAPYADVDPPGQLDRIFELARRYDVDIDLHLDFGDTPEGMQLEDVCARTVAQGWAGRVTVGHVTQLSLVDPGRYAALCELAVSAGVAMTVLPATDLFLMGRAVEHSKPRGLTSLTGMLERGGVCSLASNNILNAFTPFGDGSLVRMANLYANVAHVGTRDGLAMCLDMVTTRAARLLRADDYGIRPGAPADLVCLDATSDADAVARLAPAAWAVKDGHPTFRRELPVLTRPVAHA